MAQVTLLGMAAARSRSAVAGASGATCLSAACTSGRFRQTPPEADHSSVAISSDDGTSTTCWTATGQLVQHHLAVDSSGGGSAPRRTSRQGWARPLGGGTTGLLPLICQHTLLHHHQHARTLQTQHTPSSGQGPSPSPTPAPEQPQPQQEQDSLWTAPNMLSLARAVSAPFIAALIIQDNWPWAIAATAVSGLTDWADGALARRLGQSSVLGSYLDPLADKALVAFVVGALAYKGLAPMWLAALVVGRDVGLVVGMTLHRWRSLGWRVRGVTATQFFATTGDAGVPMMRPILVSKVNTVLQLALVSGCMTHAWVGLPEAQVLTALEVLTAGTTAASMGAYAWLYATGKMLPAPAQGKS